MKAPRQKGSTASLSQIRPVVYVIDDDCSVRKSLKRTLGFAELEVCVYPSSDEYLAKPPHRGPACLVLDINLAGENGLDLQTTPDFMKRTVPVIMVTGYASVSASIQALKAGAVDFLLKPFNTSLLLEAVHKALAVSRYELEQERTTRRIRRRTGGLTDREDEVFQLVVAGLLNKQIAAELDISEKTVKVHRARMMRKMRAQSVPDLVHFMWLFNQVPQEGRSSAR
ncbi:MAG: LuxR C-terminal-related transcriptional regulator [Acidobacteriota bacterium]|nr:LuxR C-terminal-related transcriptional regulator [Acidobacteriota bacterium]